MIKSSTILKYRPKVIAIDKPTNTALFRIFGHDVLLRLDSENDIAILKIWGKDKDREMKVALYRLNHPIITRLRQLANI